MTKWFLVKISFTVEDDKGFVKFQTEQYLFDAVSHTEAEARATEQFGKEKNDFNVAAISSQKITEILRPVEAEAAGENWYKAKVVFFSYNELTQKEKKMPYYYLINADNLLDAYDYIGGVGGLLTSTMNDCELEAICKTKILDVFEHQEA